VDERFVRERPGRAQFVDAAQDFGFWRDCQVVLGKVDSGFEECDQFEAARVGGLAVAEVRAAGYKKKQVTSVC